MPETSDAAAIVSGDRIRSRAEVRLSARRAARGLAGLGIGAGDAVALLLRNDIPVFEASLAAALIGAYPVPLNWHAGAPELADILRECAARVLVVHADLLTAIGPDLLPRLDPAPAILVVETPPEIATAYGVAAGMPEAVTGWETLMEWVAWLAKHEPIDTQASASRNILLYTSGTTGRPKALHRNAVPGAKPSARALSVYGFDDARPITALITGPLYHAVPNAYGRVALETGATIILQPRFDAEGLLALVARHRVTHMHVVPAMLVRLLALPGCVRSAYDLRSLRHVVHGAAPCPPTVKAAAIAWLGPVIHEYYGSTETGLLACHDSHEALSRPGTVGRALPGITLTIRDADGALRPSGRPGLVHAASDAMAETALGDIGWLDGDGYLHLCGRSGDVILHDGVPIYPAEIEAALLALPGVADCAVVGRADPAHGQVPVAWVEPGPGRTLDPADLLAKLGTVLDPGRMPAQIVVVAALPREDSGKIFKNRLREALAGASIDGSGSG